LTRIVVIGNNEKENDNFNPLFELQNAIASCANFLKTEISTCLIEAGRVLRIWAYILLLLNTSAMVFLLGRVIRYFTKLL